MQALDRTQPGLPIKKGRAQTMTHDYKRHGTITLFAALNVFDGQVIGQCQQRHTQIAMADMLAKDPTLVVDVFLMNRLTTGYRTRVAGRGVKATHRYAPINQYFSQSAGTVNARDYCSPDRVCRQLRKFDLGTHQRDQSQADIKAVTWFALNVPKRLRKALLIEQRN